MMIGFTFLSEVSHLIFLSFLFLTFYYTICYFSDNLNVIVLLFGITFLNLDCITEL